jgi:membrane protease YdiL (CAAX protease family)
MSFATVLSTNRLPKKPWRTGAVVRFVVSIIIGILIGAVVAAVIRFFQTTHTSRVDEFLALAAAAFASYVAAIVLLSRAWPAEPEVVRLVVLLALIYCGFFFTWAAAHLIKGDPELKNPVVAMCIAVLGFQGLTLLLVPFFLRQHFTGWFEGFGLNLHPGQSLLIGIGVGILILYPILRLNELCFELFDKLTLHPQEQQTVEILRHADTLLGRAASGIATVLIAPIGEEIIFRGILYPWAKRHILRSIALWGMAILLGVTHLNRSVLIPLTSLAVLLIAVILIAPIGKEIIFRRILYTLTKHRFSQPAALWGTAILFGAIHANLSSFLPLTLLAVLLVYLYEYTGNLLAPIAVHFVFNGANFVALFYQQK